MLGSDQPWKSDQEVYRRVLALDRPREDLASIGLTSPATILARQFASQQTAFAVAGPGPIQSDDFPILEYYAPMAFYIGHRAQGLCRFDERTWQADLAPPEKKALLASLDAASLKSVFGGRYESVNSELQACVGLLYEQPLLPKLKCIGGGVTLPCIFAVDRLDAMQPPPAALTNDVARQLFEAEAALQSTPGQQTQALEQIRRVLETTQNYQSENAGWSAAYYASIAAKASLSRGDAQRAKEIVLLGLQLEPNSDVLQYLARILDRERILPAAQQP